MSLFNRKNRVKTVLNRAGGKAHKQSPKMELASILLTSFAQDQFYRSATGTYKDLIALLSKVDPIFAAKAGIYARRVYGMRSITHVMAAELATHASGKDWAKSFYSQIVKRPDDMLEIVAYYLSKGGKKLPNAMKKGFANAFDQFDGYQLAKYRGENKQVKLIDLVNLVHPKPTLQNAKALQALVDGTLKSTQTWEAKLTQAGQSAENAQDKAKQKAQAWAELIQANKLGYFALLRNLRNIMEQAPDLKDEVIRLLTDRNRIKKSMVLPFRFMTAFDAINASEIIHKRAILGALGDALEISLDNVPSFDGKTLVVVDDSGSMTWSKNKNGHSPIRIAALFAAVLYKSNDADLMRFSDSASYLKPFFKDTAMSLSEYIMEKARSGGTDFHSIFKAANKAYDRIIILSDMQGWMGHHTPKKAFSTYKQRYSVEPIVYSFDLAGYGSMQFPESNVFALAGFSDKVFDLMKLLETDRQALIHKIEAITL